MFEQMSSFYDWRANLTGQAAPEELTAQAVTSNFFSALGIGPILGRSFSPEEGPEGHDRVTILTYGLWQRRFGGDASIVGKALILNGDSYIVVGVMPARFQFPSSGDEMWVPIAFTPKEAANRQRHYLQVVALLKPGVTFRVALL